MKPFNYLKGTIPLLLFTLLAAATLQAQTVTLNPSATQNITSGQTVNFTATRSSNSQTWPGGNGNFTYTWSASPSAGVVFTNNPNTTSGNNSSTVATFSATGSFQIICTVHEGGNGLTAASSATTVNVGAPVPANLWATSSNGTQISAYAVSNGTYIYGPTNLFSATFPGATNTYTRTAALGRNASPSPVNGYFYWLGSSSGSNNNNGLVEVFGSNASGSSVAKIGQLDLNGSNNSDLGFVRLGMGADGTGWILAGDGSTLYLAKFASNGVNPATITIEDASVSLTGGATSTFTNGDICLSGNNNIYALANDGNGVTQIFIGAPNGSSTTLVKKWDLVDNTNTAFTGQVNGVAFDVLGSLYISTADGLYYINQSTVNGPAGTVQCSLVQSQTGLQDLASNVWPQQSTLPVNLISFGATYKTGVATLSWETENEVNFSHYELERKDGTSVVYSSITSKTAAGNTGRTSYQYADNISGLSDDVFYYRLKMVDVDGHYKYSNVIMVRKEKQTITGIRINPNPVSSGDLATVRFEASERKAVTMTVVDMAGRVVLQQQNTVNEGVNSIPVNNLSRLQPGIYTIQLSDGTEQSAVKFSVIR